MLIWWLFLVVNLTLSETNQNLNGGLHLWEVDFYYIICSGKTDTKSGSFEVSRSTLTQGTYFLEEVYTKDIDR